MAYTIQPLKTLLLLLLLAGVTRCQHGGGSSEERGVEDKDDLALDLKRAKDLIVLPLECYNQTWPHGFGRYSFGSASDFASPRDLHPTFHGCFDWHSAVHGHWLMARAARAFPDSDLAGEVARVLDEQITPEKISKELVVFEDEDLNRNFERTYGWSWLLKLQEELLRSPNGTRWSRALQPMADKLLEKYRTFLPSLAYPVRVGTHDNTAFGLIFPLEYEALVSSEDHVSGVLTSVITNHSETLFIKDRACPLDWEPSGYDFLSPCLQEADLMRLVIKGGKEAYGRWLLDFLPQLFDPTYALHPGKVLDGTDYHLVHIEGVNFSRAWNLYNILMSLPESLMMHRRRLFLTADTHIRTSRDKVVGSHYAGSHWLASFYMYALERREEALKMFPKLLSESNAAVSNHKDVVCLIIVVSLFISYNWNI